MSEQDLARPSIEVRIPQVKLRLKDLAYLRSLSQTKSVRCHIAQHYLDRLRFLDLIARAKVERDREHLEKIEKEKAAKVRELRKAVEDGDWDKVNHLSYDIRRLEDQTKPIEDDVLTEKGKALLRNGEVKIRARKVGCV